MKKNKTSFRTGFTLIEVLVSLMILSAVMVSVYSAFRAGIFGARGIEEYAVIYQSAREVYGRLNTDLRNAFVYSDISSGFSGSKQNVSFFTVTDDYGESKMENNFSALTYEFMPAGRIMRLCRKNAAAFGDEAETEPEEMAEKADFEIGYGYIDPVDKSLKFKETWAGEDDPEDEKEGLPAMVKIKLVLRGKNVYNFERTIMLPNSKYRL